MIRYALNCSNGHDFEAWFRSSADFDDQKERGIVQCPTCSVTDVEKAIMAPSVSGTRKTDAAEVETGDASPAELAPVANMSHNVPAPAELVDAMREYRKLVTENAENVGEKFAEEARKIHYEEAPARGIYGNATPEEVSDLVEEGVDVAPLPVLPEDNN